MMQRNLGLLAIGVALWSGAAVHAQGPMPSPYPPIPQGYGYPSYPMPAQYRQPMRQPQMLPNNPYGQPMLPPAQGQPYYVTDMPGKAPPPMPMVQPKPAPTTETLPNVPEGEPVTIYQGPSSGQPLDTEPVTHYEGKRYFAEMKLDNTRAWVQANYIHWWIQRPSVAPLVNSGTSNLLVGEIGPREFSGAQAQLGLWLDPDHMNALEITGQWLGKASLQYAFSSGPNGNPPLSIPTSPAPIPVAAPGILAGSVGVNNLVNFHGAEVNLTQNVLRVNGWTFDYFGGFRYLYMGDELSINQSRTALTGTALSFGGAAVPVGSTVLVSDSFNVTNRFYGGDIGARLHWTTCRFDFGISGKVALGITNYTTTVDGSSTLTTPAGGSSTRVGGTFAQASNIGRITDSQFTAIPEVEATVSYRLTDHIRILGGYSFLYWNRVQRAADQLDHTVNPAQSPTSPTFNPSATGNPLFPNARSGFSVQGVNIGLELKF